MLLKEARDTLINASPTRRDGNSPKREVLLTMLVINKAGACTGRK